VHDIFASEWVSGCFRTDNFQNGTIWQDNVIYRSNAGAWEHKGGNSVINNYAIDVLPSGYFRVFRDSIDGSVIEHNLFYESRGKAVFFTFSLGPHQIAKSTVERNLYFAAGSPEITRDLSNVRAQGAGKTDVYADPLFAVVAPREFRLKPDSPALKLGIKAAQRQGRWTEIRFFRSACSSEHNDDRVISRRSALKGLLGAVPAPPRLKGAGRQRGVSSLPTTWAGEIWAATAIPGSKRPRWTNSPAGDRCSPSTSPRNFVSGRPSGCRSARSS